MICSSLDCFTSLTAGAREELDQTNSKREARRDSHLLTLLSNPSMTLIPSRGPSQVGLGTFWPAQIQSSRSKEVSKCCCSTKEATFEDRCLMCASFLLFPSLSPLFSSLTPAAAQSSNSPLSELRRSQQLFRPPYRFHPPTPPEHVNHNLRPPFPLPLHLQTHQHREEARS